MDYLASPVTSTASDESSYDDSTGPTTPASSPLFCPSRVDESLTRLLNSPPESCKLDTDSARDSLQSFPAWGAVKNVCVVGAGYVGGPTAAVLALYNPSIRVEVLDRDTDRIQRWKSAHLPVHEPGLEKIIRVVRDGAQVGDVECETTARRKRSPNLFFTNDSVRSISQADIIFLAVNTPTKTFGVGAGRATNMTATDGAVQDIARHAKPGAIIVEKSTVPCGTAQRVRQALASIRPGIPFEVLSNPEFLSEGSAVQNLTSPDRVLIGSSNTPAGRRAARVLASVYTSWVPSSRILEINAWSSELAKLVANAMLAQRISSINSISAICERTGADVDQVAQAIGLDVRIGPKFLKAGLGFGGSCFRKDIASLTYLAQSLGLEDVAHYWHQVNVMNERQRDRFSHKVIDRFAGNLVGRKLAMLGFAFKKDTGDTRESLAVDVIRVLLEERPAEIAIFDPFCRAEDIMQQLAPVCEVHSKSAVKVYTDAYSACSQAHGVLIVTDCDQFRHPTPAQRQQSSSSAVSLHGAKQHRQTFALESNLLCHEGSSPTAVLASSKSISQEEESWSWNGCSYHLMPQEACPSECSDCRSQSSRPIASEPIEWTRIAYNMKEPKWVFDGRGVLDVAEMESLGVRVDAIGKRMSGDAVPGV